MSSIAGNNSRFDTVDGVGTTAGFEVPDDIAVEPGGVIYVSDRFAHVIRRISTAGQVTTIAGTVRSTGLVNGAGAAARFTTPRGLELDGQGNLLIADSDNHVVRRLALTTGVVTTHAGSGLGSTDGSASVARFWAPSGLRLDGAGNLFVSDSGNRTIRKITPGGMVSTVAGRVGVNGSSDGLYGVNTFYSPVDLAVDAEDNIYAIDGNIVRKLTPQGLVSTIFGQARSAMVDGTGPSARFNTPLDVAVDATGNLYVTDYLNNAIRKVTPAGVVSTFRSGANGVHGVAVDAAGDIYVANVDRHVIERIAASTGKITTVAGLAGSSGLTDGTGSAARFFQPRDLALDATGNIFVIDSGNHTVRKITPAGAVTTFAGAPGIAGLADGTGQAARFTAPEGIVIDPIGTLYLCSNSTIRKITAAGMVTTLAGVAGDGRSVDGTGANARFFDPNNLAFDLQGNLIVVEGSGLVRKVTTQGVVTTLAGATLASELVDGVGLAARFYQPTGIAIDASGTVYIADTLNHTIRLGQDTAPSISVQPLSRTALVGNPTTFSLTVTGNGPLAYQWFKDGIAIAGATSASLTVANPTAEAVGEYSVSVTNTVGTVRSANAMLAVHSAPTVTTPPRSVVASVGENITLTVQATGLPAPTYQWRRNGANIVNATSSILALPSFSSSDVGIYTVVVTNSTSSVTTDAAVLGLVTTSKAVGAADEVGPNIVHANGNVYDQLLLTGASATLTADAGQVTRISFLDLTDDLVQLEFSGAGALTVTLANPTGPMLPTKYNQSISYMKGHASIVVVGANETTNVSIFSVGRATAVNQALFKDVPYDSMADVASLAITTTNGKFGGIRAGNASFFASSGLTGIVAPGVQFTGPVYFGYLSAFDSATPVLQLGAADDVRVTGGDLSQTNGRVVQVAGTFQLRFAAGTDSHGAVRPARQNQGRFERNGEDVTRQIVVNPTP